MRSHFLSSHRWFYVISSIVGGKHTHYIISQILDANSLFCVRRVIDAAFDGLAVMCDIDLPSLFDIARVGDNTNGYYYVLNGVDCNTLYNADNIGDYKS